MFEKEEMYEIQELHSSVRSLVEFIFREGDIDNRSGKLAQADAMLAGSRIHRKIQKSMGAGYLAEEPLKITIEAEEYRLEVEGRADGIFLRKMDEYELAQLESQNNVLNAQYNLQDFLSQDDDDETNLADFLSEAQIAWEEPLEEESEVDTLQEEIVQEEFLQAETLHNAITHEGKNTSEFLEKDTLENDKNNWRGEKQSAVCQNLAPGQEVWFIDEIKGMYKNVLAMEKPIFVHKAQAMCYAYIYALQNNLDVMGVQMTYCNLETEETKFFKEIFSYNELADWFGKLIEDYKRWADFQVKWRRRRQESIKSLEFPYPYREGQKQLVSDVYRTINRGKNVFIQAPTGVGKTISTIFPTVKAMGENLVDRIFYLTAKTITATVAKETFGLLREQGYVAKTIQLTAKEKLCMCDEMECNPVHCPYAKGHYDRVNDAVFDLLQKSDLFTREEILAQAEEYQVCPFEMSLDVATWVDNILCDYNYVFDPNVYLKRFFAEGSKEKYAFLVDEAHNLVDRSREMYSAELVKEDIMNVKRIMKHHHGGIEKNLDKCNKEMLNYKRECETYQIHEGVGVLMFYLTRVLSLLEEFFEKPIDFPEKSDVLDFYFAVRNFVNIYELVDDHYVIYSQINEEGRFVLKLFCVDPSANLQKCMDKAKSTVFFSATLLPVNYYKQLLSTKEDNYAIYAHSTFSPSQRLLLFGRDVSTKYTRRNTSEYEKMARYILETVQGKVGNYMAFFPSYKLMQDVADLFLELAPSEISVFMQKSNMRETEREEFLSVFEEERESSMVAFCVMGGIFGEGIDLKNDRLIGAIIVGTGLPQISNEREILKNYYDERGMSGFDYAFRYPGINKVLQAAGRVIRTNEDKGVILLLDERFLQSDYDALYPREWEERIVVRQGEVGEHLKKFWE